MPSTPVAADLLADPAKAAIGRPMDRVDGHAKVTGHATYAADAPVQGLVYGEIIQSTIARGEVQSFDTTAAEAAPGVLAVITPANIPKLREAGGGIIPEKRPPLSDMKVHHAGQHLAVVVADTPERARHAAALVHVNYTAEKPVVSLDDPRAPEEKPKQNMGEEMQAERGDVDAALARHGVTVVRPTYITPAETHNPMEMSATVAAWDGDDHLTVWDATQHVMGRRDSLASIFGLRPNNVRVLCPYVGGAFGCKGVSWPHAVLAAAAAKVVRRPVKVMLTRAQMFTSCGHRPPTRQAMTLAASSDGKLVAIRHDTTMHGSTIGQYIEPCGTASSAVVYDTPNLQLIHRVRRMDVATPTFMRAPGETPGMYALECGMDELAAALNIDPVQLRIINHADRHPSNGKAWSTKHLKEAYQLGMEKFDWAARDPRPRSMRSRDGRLLGWGMATANYPARKFPGTARIRLMADGNGVRAVGAAATQDLGTGTYTIFTQVTADQVGLPPERVTFELGDTNLPPAGVSGGSTTAASVGQALTEAGKALRAALLKLADGSPLTGLTAEQVTLRGDRLVATDDPSRSVAVAGLIAKSGRAYVEGSSVPPGGTDEKKAEAKAAKGGPSEPPKDFDFHSFGAHFVEVTVDEPVPAVRVTRVVSVIDVGRVLNPKTAGSQVIGGVVMGIGMVLLEETVYDANTGRPVNDNLADYPVCVNPDIHAIEPYFVGVPDMQFNPLGCRGVGEIGITGVAAAVANAVYHATGRRVRELPITIDKLL